MGFTLRRLTSKLACAVAIPACAAGLAPRQVGVGIPGGLEGAVHAVSRFAQSLDQNRILAKLDFTNAFNCLSRKTMFAQVAQSFPCLYPYVASSYSSPSWLHYEGALISSAEGVQQGDPLGPLLFCLTVQPLLNSLKADLVVGYLDWLI